MAGNDVNTLLLLHGEDLTDASQYARVLTNSGVTVSDAQSKFGGKSLYFNGAAKILLDAIDFGAGDFTVDWWEYVTSSASSARFCTQYTTETANIKLGGILLGFAGTAVYASSYISTGAWDLISGANMFSNTLNTWVHWAAVRSGTTFTTYRNGVKFATVNISGAIVCDEQYKTVIGDYRAGDEEPFIGYIDEFRVSNIARWTENFTPPIAAYEYDKPDALKNLAYAINSAGGVELTWNAATYATKYEIARDGIEIATTSETHYTDSEATLGNSRVYVVTPYNRTQAGESAAITVRTALDTPDILNATLDGKTVTLTWGAVSGAEGYKVYRDGAVVASVASTTYTDTLTPPASVAYAVSAYAGTIKSEISQTVVVENWEGVLLALITDRTAADVAEAKRLRDKLIAGEALTDEESARYFAGLRGVYNASDMNRVGAAVRYVAGRLNAEGYGAYVSPKTDWQMEDIVRQSDWNKYLDEVRHLRRKLTLMRTTPQITDGMYSGLKSYAEANAIEQILVDLDIAITCIIRNYIFSGEVFAGEV